MILYLVLQWLAIFLLTSHIRVEAIEGIVETLSGGGYPHIGEVDSCLDDSFSQDGSLLEARFKYPWGIVYDHKEEAVYVADCGCPESKKKKDFIRKIDLRTNQVITIAGSKQGYKDGSGRDASFMHIAGMAIDHMKRIMYIADSGNNVIRQLDINNNEVTTFSGKFGDGAFADGPLKTARFNNPQQLEWRSGAQYLYVSDTDNHAIRMIKLKGSIVTTITGGPNKLGFRDGSLQQAKWHHPSGLVYDSKRDVLYVSDHYNHAVRKVDLHANRVTTIAGKGSPGRLIQTSIGAASELHYPEGIVYDQVEDVLYFAEFSNNCIRMITLSDNKVHLLAGGGFGTRDAVGQDAQFYHPTSLDYDPSRKILYVTDQYNHRIRTVTTLGNTQVGHPNAMMIRHMGKVDAYRDLTVHHRSAFSSFVTVVIMIVVTLIAFRVAAKTCLKNRKAWAISLCDQMKEITKNP